MSRFGNLRSTVCITAGLLILFLAGCQAGGTGTLRLRGENWSPSPGGAIRASDLGSAGDLIDLEGDLGLGGDESLWVYALEADLGVTTAEISTIDFSSTSTSSLASSVDFGGITFSGDVESQLSVSIDSLRSINSFADFELIGVNYIYGADNLVFNSVISSSSSPDVATSSIDEWLPVFGLGLNAEVPVGTDWNLELDAEVAGLWFSYGDIDGTYQGTTLRAGLRQGSGMLIGVGHRSLIIDIEDDGSGTSADIDLGGTYLFLEWAI